MMNFDLAIVMYGDARFKHTLIIIKKKQRITVFDPYHRVFEIRITRLKFTSNQGRF